MSCLSESVVEYENIVNTDSNNNEQPDNVENTNPRNTKNNTIDKVNSAREFTRSGDCSEIGSD